MKKIVGLLFVAFVGISVVVAFVPSITGISTAGLTGITKAAADLSLWLIPLGASFLLLMMGVRAFSKTRQGRRAAQHIKDSYPAQSYYRVRNRLSPSIRAYNRRRGF